jgi:hypothetical protein
MITSRANVEKARISATKLRDISQHREHFRDLSGTAHRPRRYNGVRAAVRDLEEH